MFLFVDGRETDEAERLRDSGGGGEEDLQEPGSSVENQVLYWKRLTRNLGPCEAFTVPSFSDEPPQL